MTGDTGTFGQKLAATVHAAVAYAVLAFLVPPIAVIVPLSFSSGGRIGRSGGERFAYGKRQIEHAQVRDRAGGG